MKNIINPQKTLLAALLSVSPLFIWTTPSSAAMRSYTAFHEYESCGSVQRTMSEARLAARKKVRQLRARRRYRRYRVTLKNFKIISHSTQRRIKGNGYSRTETCSTSLMIRVFVDIKR